MQTHKRPNAKCDDNAVNPTQQNIKSKNSRHEQKYLHWVYRRFGVERHLAKLKWETNIATGCDAMELFFIEKQSTHILTKLLYVMAYLEYNRMTYHFDFQLIIRFLNILKSRRHKFTSHLLFSFKSFFVCLLKKSNENSR